MKQKIIKIGNSSGMIIPQLLQQQLGLQVGSEVHVQAKEKGLLIQPIKKNTVQKKRPITQSFTKTVNRFMQEHADVLEALAKR